MSNIHNSCNLPLFSRAGTVPDVSGAIQDYYQSMVFMPLTKTVVGFQVVETANPINFRGMVQPFTGRQLQLLPEGQRAWTWMNLISDTSLQLNVDDIIQWNGQPTRVMFRNNCALYGHMQYHIVQDWI